MPTIDVRRTKCVCNNESRAAGLGILILGALISAGLLGASAGVQAQGIVMAGNYQNFDVLNNTGGPTYGFEMEVWGVSKSQLTRIFPSNFNAGVIRYGFGTATDFPGGDDRALDAPYDPASGQFTSATPEPPSLTTVPGDSCWTLGMPNTYKTAGCEHFGISTTYNVNPTTINYRWLVPDPANPGTLIRRTSTMSICRRRSGRSCRRPIQGCRRWWSPRSRRRRPPAPAVFGDAQWVKVYKTEQPGKVEAVDDLVGDNHAVVPEDAAQLEVDWSLLQAGSARIGREQAPARQAGRAAATWATATMRWCDATSTTSTPGVYDPITHEALCADLTCTAPGPGELGDAIGAQNAAANLDVNALTVSVVGGGNVSSSDKVYSCGNKCYGVYNPGTTVTLTAKANSGSTFSGWSGACAGNASTCSVLLNAESSVTATFLAVAARWWRRAVAAAVVVAAAVRWRGQPGDLRQECGRQGHDHGQRRRDRRGNQLRQRLFRQCCTRHDGDADGRTRRGILVRQLDRCVFRRRADLQFQRRRRRDSAGEFHEVGA